MLYEKNKIEFQIHHLKLKHIHIVWGKYEKYNNNIYGCKLIQIVDHNIKNEKVRGEGCIMSLLIQQERRELKITDS